MLRVLNADASLDVRWGAPGDLDRLLDRDHAAVVQTWAGFHQAHGWVTFPEASYSIYGERGRIDLLSFHPQTGTLEVAEVKSGGTWDTQDMLGRLDAKIRLAPQIAAQHGWNVTRVVGALVIADGRTARRRVAEHEPLLARFASRGAAARAFVRAPSADIRGVLAFVPLPDSNHGRSRRAGQRSVRVKQA